MDKNRCRNCGGALETVNGALRHAGNRAIHCDLDDDCSLTAEAADGNGTFQTSL